MSYRPKPILAPVGPRSVEGRRELVLFVVLFTAGPWIIISLVRSFA